MDSGSWADWVAAIATTLGFIAAGIAAFFAARQLGILRDQELDRRQRDIETDAAGVAIWARTSAEDLQPVVRYINLSGKPVYELSIWVETPEHCFLIYRTVTGPHHEPREMRQSTRELRESAATVGYEPDWHTLLDLGDLRCACRFRDTRNRWWLRDFDGRLSSVDDSSTSPDTFLPTGLRPNDGRVIRTAPTARISENGRNVTRAPRDS